MEKGILTENHIKEYFKNKKNAKAMDKFANFHFLVYLAKIFDGETAYNIGNEIAVKESCDGEMIDQLLTTVLGYD